MKLIFKYDHDKDIENFLKSAYAKNSKKPTRLQKLYFDKYGTNPDEENAGDFIKDYINKNSIDADSDISRINTEWNKVGEKLIDKMKSIFGLDYPHDITVYLSSNSRCTYNIKENYFFLHSQYDFPVGIIAHELLHFFTGYVFYEELKEKGVSDEKYNDIKESLTEILNLAFKDLLNGYYDKGYPQHTEMRKRVSDLWKQEENIINLVETLVKEF